MYFKSAWASSCEVNTTFQFNFREAVILNSFQLNNVCQQLASCLCQLVWCNFVLSVLQYQWNSFNMDLW